MPTLSIFLQLSKRVSKLKMSPKRVRQQNKTVTIYNSKNNGGNNKKEKKRNLYEQSRNSMENWEFHYKSNELEDIRTSIKCKELTGVPLIIGAVVLNQKDVLGNLLKHGYNINEADKNNMTPLCWAVKLKHVEMIQVLLTNKADPGLKPHNGDDILFMALGSSQWDEESFILLWNYLKNVGHIDVNSTNKNGLSMLHLAVRREWNILVDILISADVNINVTNSSGVTPLMLASYRNDYGIVTRLLSKGAGVKRRNSDGFTALCYAFSSAIMKKLTPPYLVVEKIQGELAKNKIQLSHYLKERLKIILHPPKKPNADQPSTEQMLQHIICFTMCHLRDGFDVLWNELDVIHFIKNALDKSPGDKDNLKLPLIVLNTIAKNLPSCLKDTALDDAIIQGFAETGCFDTCLSLSQRYIDSDMIIFLALSPIINSASIISSGRLNWFKEIEDCSKHLEKFLEVLPTINLSNAESKTLQEKCEALRIKLQKTPTIEIARELQPPEKLEPKCNTKKSKRRSKALKAKLTKLKTAELTERLNVASRIEKKDDESLEEETLSQQEESVCVDAIKAAIGLLEEEKQSNEKPKQKQSNTFFKEDWKTIIQKLPFHNCPNIKAYKPTNEDLKNYKYLDVDSIIKYLEELLTIIVNKYQIIWALDKPFHHLDSDDDFLTLVEPSVEAQQNMEKEKLRVVHREFYNLTRNVRQLYERDPEFSQHLLKELEKLLLTHSIRGETILEQVAAMEVVKVNVTMPADFENLLPSYVESVINMEMDEIDTVNIQVLEHVTAHKNIDTNSMGDYVYLNHISNLLSRRFDCNAALANNKSGPYHLASSILNICDDNDDMNQACCNKGCIKATDLDESKDSRWCSMLRSLEMMEDCQIFFNGKIRISNMEKRKSHVLSPSGNFASLEIGLGQDNLPIAVKFVPKNDTYATLLKSQIDPFLELRHKNILHYYLCAYDMNFLVIATPLCEYNLGQYVLKMKHTQMKICKVGIIRQILGGLMFLHDHDEPIVHGNLKPSNVLIDVYGNVRIAEFGIHKALLKLKNLPESTIIWFATETYRLYKQNGSLECTCASDIQVVGMLVHFAVNNGSHPFGKDVIDILKSLEKATPQILSKDMELYDLLTWMLLGEPSERPTIHQVLSHIFFWSNKKKWRYILACAGIGTKTTIPMDIEKLHASLDKTALKENIVGNCWVLTAKKQYPQATFVDNNDTPSGLLKFIKLVVENNMILQDEGEKSLSFFILNAFPYFALSLYRMIENTEWSDHRVFMPFHNVVDY